MKIENKILLLNCLFCLAFFTKGLARGVPSDTIIWSKDRLKWSDFQQDYSIDRPVIYVAKSKWQMFVRFEPMVDHPEIKVPIVKAIFFRKMSWVKPTSSENEDVLRHEQLHFDIVELYSRKLRLALGGVKIDSESSLKKTLKLVHKINDDMFDAQESYDRETSHGTDKKKQVWWTTSIFLQLEETDGL